jgi:hypothetical protein
VTISPSHIGTPAAPVVSAPFVLRDVIAQFLVFGGDRRYPRHLRLTDIDVIPGVSKVLAKLSNFCGVRKSVK